MTETVLKEIVHRAVRDGSYRALLQRDPAAALAGYSLSADERGALMTGDASKLTALGIDQRMSKAFTVGLISEASKMIVVDAGAGEAVVDEPQTERSYNWRVEQNIDTIGGVASVLDAPATVRSFNWTVEQNIDTARALDAEADAAPAAIVDGPATERSFNWTVEQNLDAGDSLETGTPDQPADGNTISEF